MKFNLDNEDGESDTNIDFLTHKGKKLEEMDDFKDKIEQSDDDLYEDKDLQKGRMNEEMVNMLNFGGYEGEDPVAKKKTREERHAEIMEKSKAYKYHAQEILLANQEATR